MTTWARSRASSFPGDTADVRLRRRGTDNEALGDFFVRETGRDERHHLALAFRQRVDAGHRPPRPQRSCELLDQAPRHARRQQRLAGGDDTDGLEECGRLGVLDEERARAGTQPFEDVFIGLERSQDHEPDARQPRVGRNLPDCLDAVEVGHPDVHEDDVRPEARGEVDSLAAIARFPDDLEVLLGIDEGLEAGPDEGLVVREQDPDHVGA